jgi:hypothetical protein
MNFLAKAILRGVFDRIHVPDLLRPAADWNVGGGLVHRIAAAGILRVALRWPAFTLILALSLVAARVLSDGRHKRNRGARILRAPR